MTNAAKATPPAVATSAADSVFETILADIVRGVYPPKSRLPAERELARTLGASRPTLREALGRLAEWNLVEARRGSGVVVLEQREWNLEVLPAYLKFGSISRQPKQLLGLVRDLLALRHQMIVELVRLIAGRVDVEKLAPARAALETAWAARGTREFTREDFKVMKAIIDAADFKPGLWLLNRMAGVYLEIAANLSGTLPPPADYVEAHTTFLDALANGNSDLAMKTISEYLLNHDRRLTAALEAMA